MIGSWSLPPVPGYITMELPTMTAALEAFHKAEREAEEAGYFTSTTWRGDAGDADILFFATEEDRRRWNEATGYRDCPRPVAALRWVWPADKR